MRDMRSVVQAMRLRAEQGATREELEVELRGDGLSGVEPTVLEAYVWALIRVFARAPEAGGEQGDPRP
jgi:hypothetical protein